MNKFNAENPKTIQLQEVEIGKNYAIVISTNAGLWRYLIGDTVTFTSTSPYRILITGRTKSFINVVGEEVIIDNAEKAIEVACQKTGAVINEYTAAPLMKDGDVNHQWIIEFTRLPDNPDFFCEVLDNALKSANSDYEAKRYHDLVLTHPVVIQVPEGTFYRWMKLNDKLGGQNKVPRLSNERKYVDEILGLL